MVVRQYWMILIFSQSQISYGWSQLKRRKNPNKWSNLQLISCLMKNWLECCRCFLYVAVFFFMFMLLPDLLLCHLVIPYLGYNAHSWKCIWSISLNKLRDSCLPPLFWNKLEGKILFGVAFPGIFSVMDRVSLIRSICFYYISHTLLALLLFQSLEEDVLYFHCVGGGSQTRIISS